MRHLVGAACFGEFSTQPAVLFAEALVGGGCGVGFACCDGLVAPGAQGLGAAAQRLGHDPDGSGAWSALGGLTVEDHPHGAFAELGGELLGHDPILLQEARNQTQGAS